MHVSRRAWAAWLATSVAGCSTRSGGEASDGDDAVREDPRRHVIDLHCDTPLQLRRGNFDLGARNETGEVDIPRMRDGGVTAAFFSVYTSARENTELEAVRDALEIIDTVQLAVRRFPDDLSLALSADEIESARQAGRIAILIGVEGGHMIGSSLGVLRSLWRLGARYLTLTHSKDTPWAGSSGSESNAGLSAFGREVVAEMNRLGMMVDVSHVSDQTFWDALETSSAPVIATHSSVRAIRNHKRNMTDEMIRATAERGGVVHVNYYADFLDSAYAERSRAWEAANPDTGRGEGPGARTKAKLAAIGRPSLDVLLDHFQHVARVGGVEATGLGSDFDGVDGELPQGMEDISKIPALASGLAQRGFAEADIEKILGLNSLRVFRDVESAARAGSVA